MISLDLSVGPVVSLLLSEQTMGEGAQGVGGKERSDERDETASFAVAEGVLSKSPLCVVSLFLLPQNGNPICIRFRSTHRPMANVNRAVITPTAAPTSEPTRIAVRDVDAPSGSTVDVAVEDVAVEEWSSCDCVEGCVVDAAPSSSELLV